jgi:hypothetical protein
MTPLPGSAAATGADLRSGHLAVTAATACPALTCAVAVAARGLAPGAAGTPGRAGRCL